MITIWNYLGNSRCTRSGIRPQIKKLSCLVLLAFVPTGTKWMRSSQGLGGGGAGGGWGKRSCCYFTIGLIFGDFPRRCHIFNPSSCRCCQLAFLLSYVAVSWPCSWSEFNVSGIASLSVVCFTERKRELGNEVGGEAWGLGLRHLIFRVWEMEAPTDELLAKLKPAGPRNIIFEADSPFILDKRAPKSQRI